MGEHGGGIFRKFFRWGGIPLSPQFLRRMGNPGLYQVLKEIILPMPKGKQCLISYSSFQVFKRNCNLQKHKTRIINKYCSMLKCYSFCSGTTTPTPGSPPSPGIFFSGEPEPRVHPLKIELYISRIQYIVLTLIPVIKLRN